MGLWYPTEIRFELKAFADADYAGCHDTRRSTSGSAQFLGHRLGSYKGSLESSVKNPIPIPSESNVISNGDSKCDMPINDDSPESRFATFDNPLFDSNDDFSSDDESLSEKEIPKEEFKFFSNPLYDIDDEIITNEKILPNQKDLDVVILILPGMNESCFNAESDLLESLLNRDSPIDSTKDLIQLIWVRKDNQEYRYKMAGEISQSSLSLTHSQAKATWLWKKAQRELGFTLGSLREVTQGSHQGLPAWYSFEKGLQKSKNQAISFGSSMLLDYYSPDGVSKALARYPDDDCDSTKYGYIKNHKKTIKNGQARTRERKSEQKPEAKPKKSQASVK
ncbi:hypothetical protein Tco_1490552 [Tanacetum coccineum]